MSEKVIPIDKIRVDRDTQSRVEVNQAVVDEYAEAMARHVVFPPMLVFYDKQKDEFILADGFHRYHAYCKARPGKDVTVDRRFGNAEQALWASITANKSHGLPRTTADKRKAVRLALLHPKGAAMSNVKISNHVGVSDKTVASVRSEMVAGSEIPNLAERRGLDGKVYPASSRVAPEIDPSAVCGQCDLYNGRTCLVDENVHRPWEKACEDFDPKPEAQPEPPEEPMPQPGEYKIVDPPSEKDPNRQNKPSQYKQIKGRLRVYLPEDNAQLCAIELRNTFSQEYMTGVIQILQHLYADEEAQ